FKFVSGGEPATSSFFGKLGFVVLVASLLPFFLGPHREGLIDLGGAAAADFLFEFLDALPGRFELPLEGHDDVDQATDADASRGDILLKLLVGVHAKNLSNRQPRSCPSFENSVNGPIFCRGPCVRDLTATPQRTCRFLSRRGHRRHCTGLLCPFRSGRSLSPRVCHRAKRQDNEGLVVAPMQCLRKGSGANDNRKQASRNGCRGGVERMIAIST